MSQINVTTIRNRTGGAPNLDQGIVVGAAATFSGNVSVGGTLTYEDVTNVDSVGIITARSGLQVISGQTLINTTDNGSDPEPPLIVSGRGNDATDSGMIRIKRGTVAASLTAGDSIGDITWTALDGGQCAQIGVKAGTGWGGTDDSPGQIIIKTTPDGSGTLEDRLTLNSDGSCTFSGDVNIGNPTPNWASRLDVTGGTDQSAITAATTSDTYKGIVVLNSSGTDMFWANGQGTGYFANDVTFGSSFNSASTSGYGAKVDLAANAATFIAQCQDTASQFTELFAGYKGTTKPFYVIANGTVTCVTLTETSDIALKTDIEPITNVLDKIQQITGYTYKFKDDGRDSMGVTAQDVEKVFPELVHGEDGNKSLQYSGLIGALIESVKELSAKVAALEANVD